MGNNFYKEQVTEKEYWKQQRNLKQMSKLRARNHMTVANVRLPASTQSAVRDIIYFVFSFCFVSF